MHYYTFYAKDYLSKTSFLEPMEDLAYRRMLDYYYLEEKPLPTDLSEIAMLIRMRSHTDCIANVLRLFFEVTESGYINKKAEFAIEDYHSKKAKAKASADARWSKVKEQKNKKPSKNMKLESECEVNANALRTECEMDANYKLLTNNQEPYIQDKPVKFFFKKALVDLGVDSKLVDEWLVVRKTKKASNTETALKGFIGKVEKSGVDLNTALKICVERSWTGFDKSWLDNLNISDYQEKVEVVPQNSAEQKQFKPKRNKYLDA